MFFSKNWGIYRFLCWSQVLITMYPVIVSFWPFNLIGLKYRFSTPAGSRAPPDPRRQRERATVHPHTAALATPGERTGDAPGRGELSFFTVGVPKAASNHHKKKGQRVESPRVWTSTTYSSSGSSLPRIAFFFFFCFKVAVFCLF